VQIKEKLMNQVSDRSELCFSLMNSCVNKLFTNGNASGKIVIATKLFPQPQRTGSYWKSSSSSLFLRC